jgi:hypothetical protein
LLILIHSTIAQVFNDKADHARPLLIDSLPYPSDTRFCTLEEKCIDRKLTARCLVFHNDQWFTFTTGIDSVHYLSIRNQYCEEVNGVQVLVLEGHLCKPSTYKIIDCISLATQDDIYLTLRNLKHHHTYIINVDGYLHDLCKFEIGITTKVPEFAVLPLSSPQTLEGSQKNGTVVLEWNLTEELQQLKTVRFEVKRRFEQEKKFIYLSSIEAERTVHGESKREYQYLDTVGRKGFYHYQVIAIAQDGRQYNVGAYTLFCQPFRENPYLRFIELPCKDKTSITFLIYNWENNLLMDKIQTLYTGKNYPINFGPYFRDPIQRLKVVAVDKNNEKIKEFLIDRLY